MARYDPFETASYYAMGSGQPNVKAAYYAALLDNPNVQRGLATLRASEGTARARDPYSVGFGFDKIADLSWHPGKSYSFNETTGRKSRTTAAGAYQFLGRTWNGVARELGLTNFGPKSQDVAALALIDRRGGLDNLVKGDLTGFVKAVGPEWASLPTAPYPQPKHSWYDIKSMWAGAGLPGKNAPTPSARPETSFAAPAGVVERAPLPSIQDIARTKGYQQYGASRAAALQPTLPDTIAAPPTLTRTEDYFGPPAAIPRSRPVTPADMPYSVSPRAAPAIDPVTVRATAAGAPSVGVHGTGTTSPMAGFDETVPTVPSVGFPAPPSVPGRDARMSAAKGALMGGLRGGPMGALIGAALGPAKDQIIGNIKSNMQGMGRVPVFSGVRDAYRGMFNFGGDGSFGGLLSTPDFSTPAFGIGSGYDAIGSVFNAPGGATAYSRSNPEVSFRSLGNGMVERSNSRFGTTSIMSADDYNAGSRGKSKK